MEISKRKKKMNPHDDDSTRVPVQVQTARTNMALLHFIMTSPKWSVSLILFLAATQSPIQTPKEAVQQPLERLQAVLDMESRSYQQCALDSAVELQRELQIAAQKEHDRVSVIHQANTLFIEKARRRKEKCFNSAHKAQNILRQWNDSGHVVDSVQDRQVCSDDRRETMERLLGGDFKLLEEEVTSLWEQHLQDSLHGLQLIHDYAEARFQYDYEYFVGLRIQPALELIAALPNIESPDFSIGHLALRERITEALLRLQDALNRAQMTIEALKMNLSQISGYLQAFYTAYTDIFDRMIKGALFVRDILPPGVPMPGFFDITLLPVADSMMPSFADIGVFELDFDSMYLLISETAELCMNILQETIRDLMAQAERALRGTLMKVVEALTSVLQLEGYDPPRFIGSQGLLSSLAGEVAFQSNLGWTTLEQTRTLLERAIAIEMQEEEARVWEITLENGEDSLPDDSTTFAYLRPILPSLFFPKFLALLVAVGSTTTWILEVVVQAFRLWKLEDAYSKAVTPDLPEVNYDKNTGESDEHEALKTRQVILSLTFKALLVPRMVTAVIAVPVIFGAALLWYPHVKANCEETREGTFLANRFIAPILVNEANALGNAYYLKAELQCYKTQRQICQQMQAQTLARYQTDYSTFSDLESDFYKSVQVVETMKDCVEENTKRMINDSCCGIKNFAPCANASAPGFCSIDHSEGLEISFRPLEEHLWEPACDGKGLPTGLVQPDFECENMSRICERIPCGGVDKVGLIAETVETDCEVQLYGLRLVFFVFLALYHAIVVNLVSTLLFQGIRILRWRQLYPDGIYFRTNMREDGSLSEGYRRQDRADRASMVIRRFELAGRLQIYVACVVFLIWALLTFCPQYFP